MNDSYPTEHQTKTLKKGRKGGVQKEIGINIFGKFIIDWNRTVEHPKLLTTTE